MADAGRGEPGGVPDLHEPACPTGPPARIDLRTAEEYLLEALERLDASEMRAGDLEHALTHSRHIGMAMGVLMAMEKVTEAEAFDRLRRASMHQNRKLYIVAEDVLERGGL